MTFEIVRGYVTGMIGDITRLHALHYRQTLGFGLAFEARVARDIAAFMERYNEQIDGIWSIVHQGQVAGCIIIDGSQDDLNQAHLRYFFVSEAIRGQGAGRQLMQIAIDFCIETGFDRVHLKTLDSMEAARHLYSEFGFAIVSEAPSNVGTEFYLERQL